MQGMRTNISFAK